MTSLQDEESGMALLVSTIGKDPLACSLLANSHNQTERMAFTKHIRQTLNSFAIYPQPVFKNLFSDFMARCMRFPETTSDLLANSICSKGQNHHKTLMTQLKYKRNQLENRFERGPLQTYGISRMVPYEVIAIVDHLANYSIPTVDLAASEDVIAAAFFTEPFPEDMPIQELGAAIKHLSPSSLFITGKVLLNAAVQRVVRDMNMDSIFTASRDLDSWKQRAASVQEKLWCMYNKNVAHLDPTAFTWSFMCHAILNHPHSTICIKHILYSNNNSSKITKTKKIVLGLESRDAAGLGVEANTSFVEGVYIYELFGLMASDASPEFHSRASEITPTEDNDVDGPLEPRLLGGTMRLVNHDCTPNVAFAAHTGTPLFIAWTLQSIQRGEEIVANYGSDYCKTSERLCKSCQKLMHQTRSLKDYDIPAKKLARLHGSENDNSGFKNELQGVLEERYPRESDSVNPGSQRGLPAPWTDNVLSANVCADEITAATVKTGKRSASEELEEATNKRRKVSSSLPRYVPDLPGCLLDDQNFSRQTPIRTKDSSKTESLLLKQTQPKMEKLASPDTKVVKSSESLAKFFDSDFNNPPPECKTTPIRTALKLNLKLPSLISQKKKPAKDWRDSSEDWTCPISVCGTRNLRSASSVLMHMKHMHGTAFFPRPRKEMEAMSFDRFYEAWPSFEA